jgi:hypothetical protein
MTIKGHIVSIDRDLDWGYFAAADQEVYGFRLTRLMQQGSPELGTPVIASVEEEEVLSIAMYQVVPLTSAASAT